MPQSSRLDISKKDIIQRFDEDSHRIFTKRDIEEILAQERGFWRLAQSTTFPKFIEFLTEKTRLKIERFDLPYRPTLRYIWGEAPFFEMIQSLRPNGFFSHYTAVFIHGLTEQIPKKIYLNDEQRNRGGGGELTQERIKRAFRGKCRTSNNITQFKDYSICILNGQNTGCLGVIDTETSDGSHVRITNLERTLIDIVVRPVYSGGVDEVLKAFSAAKKQLSVNRLLAQLRSLNFTYPYHQSIGFYLDRAGYSSKQLDLTSEFKMDYDFYLTYGMRDTEYIKKWRLFVPKGL